MPSSQDLMGTGMPSMQADLLGYDPQAVTATGTTQATAAAIRSEMPQITATGGATGAILPSDAKIGSPFFVSSIGGTAAKIYAPVGHTLNGVASSTGLTFQAATGTAIFIRTGTTTWVCTGTTTLA